VIFSLERLKSEMLRWQARKRSECVENICSVCPLSVRNYEIDLAFLILRGFALDISGESG